MTHDSDWTLRKWEAPKAPDPENQEDRHLQLLARQADFEAVLLGSFGMTIATIAQFTGMSEGRVRYRLKKAGIKVRDFRLGKGLYAEAIFSAAASRTSRILTQELRKLEEGIE